MRWPHHLFSVVQFFLVLLLIIGGIFCIVLPYASSLKVTLSNLFLWNDRFFFSLGGILLVVGIVLGIGFYFLQRQEVLQISMNPPVTIEKAVVAALVRTYFQSRFPGQELKAEAIVHPGGSLELISDIPSFPPEQLSQQLQEIEVELGEILYRTLKYQKKFLLTFV